MKKQLYNLTNPQKSIWLTEQYFSSTCVNNLCGTVDIDEKVNFDKLKKAINIFIKDNDSFRINLSYNENGEILQSISEYIPLEIELIDLKDEKELASLENKMVDIPFSILNSFLHNFKMYRFPNGKGGFVLVAHHLICDACTASLVASKVINIYSSLLKNEEITENSTSYINYIQSENEYLSSNKFEKDKEYWNAVFKTIPEIGNIPSIKQENEISCKAKRKTFIVQKEQLEKINKFCSLNKISNFNFFMALYAIYIGRVSNLNDFSLGTPILNRSTFVEKNTPGMFISTIPFRFNLVDGLSFIDFTKKIAFDSLGMFRHQKYPYQNILEDIRKINPSQPNLYDILISYQNTKTNRNSAYVPYEVKWTFNHNLADSMQIHLFDMNDEGKLNISYDYRLDKYDEEDICNIHNRILYMIDQVLSSDNLLIENIDIVAPKEKEIILNDFNNTSLEYDKTKTIVDYFEEQVKKTPNNIALVFENKALTYIDLNKKVNSLANFLRKNGIKNDNIVGVMINRSFEMIISLLAVLKAGGAYIPIDPEYPEERISYMLKNSNCSVLLSENILKEKIKKISFSNTIIYTDLNEDIYNDNFENPIKISKPDDLSYLIYTSGSTGMPKGVMLTHKNLNNFYNSMINTINYLKDGKYHSIVSITTVSFDIFAFETIISLTRGLKLFITNNTEQKMTVKLEKLLLDNKIEILQTTPSIMNFHLENSTINGFSNLKYIMLAGEQLPIQLVNKIKSTTSNCTIYNGYGPSETTIFSTVKDVTDLENITIGRPIHNTQIFILDDELNLLPQGTLGEIYISGDGVGRGYLNNKDLTSERYLNNPYIDNSIMYKTGDVGIWLKNGEILCKGRIDNQIKLRGLRIELGEIETKINNFNTNYNIKSAVIIKNINGKDTLNAFISSNTPINLDDLEKYLLNYLPTYMIPNSFTILEELPFTPNGKIDRKILKSYSINTPKSLNMKLPETKVQKVVFEHISKLTNNDSIGILDSFFNIGLDSLCIINLASVLSKQFNIELTVRDIYDSNNIENLSLLIETLQKNNNYSDIIKTDIKDYYHVSSAQKRVFYSSKVSGENSTLYNMPGAIVFDKKPDINKLNKCFKILLERHSSLRTYFEIINGEVYQKVLDNVNFEILEQTENNKTIDEILKDFIKPFDLTKAPLLRANFVNLKDKFLLLFDMHHIISDGLSLSILTTELSKIYNEEELSVNSLSYIDYAEWEYKNLKENTMQESKDYWINQFKDDIPVLNMPTDYPRQATKTFEGGKVYKTISNDLTQKINSLAKNLDVSNYMLLLACYYVLLSKYTSQEDIVVGTPVLGRNKEELLNIIGMFVNSLPLKNHIESSMTFYDFVKNVKENSIEALSHQIYPFDELVNNLNISRDNSRNPLFDTMFIYQNNGMSPITFNGINTKYYLPDNNISKFDFSLEVVPTKSEFNLTFEYCTKLFNKDTIERFAVHFINILEKIVDNYELKISDIDILSEDEKNKILYEFNDTKMDYPNIESYIDLFYNQVFKNENKVAVIFNNNQLTYKELNEKSNQIANYLISKGIKNNDIVGLLVNRSLEMITAMIGILKAGAAYLPIDPTYPKSRIDYMLKDSKVNIILSQRKLIETLNLSNAIAIDFMNNNDIYNAFSTENVTINISPDNFAYLIYTSGSTGTPKGVVINHKNINNFITGMCNNIDFSSNKKIVSVTTMCFDIFVLETLLPLQKGLTIILASEEEQTIPKNLNALCKRYNVDIIQTTPSKFSLLLADENELDYIKNLKTIILGGEALPEKLLATIKDFTNANIYNVYGPTETTVWSSIKDLKNTDYITIGKPIANTQMYILDDNKKLVPIGIPGELYIGGEGVCNGYYNKEDITAERFTINNFTKSGYIYKTGDLAKWLPSGEIQYIGRTDFQVKLHGLRIELGEIESSILKFPNINNCVVCIKTDSLDRQVLCAYIISNERISISNLKNYLTSFLPSYMVPTYILQIDKFKYTPNGKIDRKALPNPKSISENKSIILPETETEKKLLKLWENLLNISPISIDDKFFNIGGDSILALKMQIELLNRNINITYADIFKYDTIKSLALKIDSLIISKNIFNYDVDIDSSINNILQKNTISNIKPLANNSIGNILLTGVTGFLGANLLENIILNTSSNIYCLVRKDPSTNIEEKVKNRLHIYFGNKYDSLFNNRIFLIQGNISSDNLGLSNEVQENLANNIDIVINSAAIVKHFGYYSDFEKINVTGVQNLINFCLKYNKKLVQISTTSVSGNTLTDLGLTNNTFKDEIYFSESDLYVKQSLENVYVRSKFEAEKLILKNMALYSLDSLILRVGNITARYSDGIFQYNENENAFMNRLKAFLILGIIPDYLLSSYMEFTPADILADSIVKSIKYANNNISVLHLYNYNHVYINNFVSMLPEGLIKVVPEDIFKQKITNYFNTNKQTNTVSFLSNDMDLDKKLIYDSKIKIKSNFTKEFLEKINFEWPTINKNYIYNLLKLLK